MRRINPREGNVPRKIARLASMGGLLREEDWPEIWECHSPASVLEKMEKYELDGSVFIPRTSEQVRQEDRAYIVAFGYQVEKSSIYYGLEITAQGVPTNCKRVIYFAYAAPNEVRRWRRGMKEYAAAKAAEQKLKEEIESAESPRHSTANRARDKSGSKSYLS